jgi:hypothetical protein
MTSFGHRIGSRGLAAKVYHRQAKDGQMAADAAEIQLREMRGTGQRHGTGRRKADSSVSLFKDPGTSRPPS